MCNFITLSKRGLLAVTLVATFGFPVTPVLADDHSDDFYDNLVRVEKPSIQVAYIDPNVDFSVFTRVALADPYVAFRSNWQRDQNRGRRGTSNVSNRDMERIREDVATLFERVFTERLESAGYEVVSVVGDDVLGLRPAIIDLDITAPDTRTAGRSRTFTSSTGAATLFMELVDSVTGQTLGRGADRRTIRSMGGSLSWSNRVSNSADARRMMGQWADLLVSFLDQHYKAKKPE